MEVAASNRNTVSTEKFIQNVSTEKFIQNVCINRKVYSKCMVFLLLSGSLSYTVGGVIYLHPVHGIFFFNIV